MDLKKEAAKPDNRKKDTGLIGEFLVRVAAISPGEARHIARHQKKSPQKLFGEIALEKGFIYDEATKRYLASRGFI